MGEDLAVWKEKLSILSQLVIGIFSLCASGLRIKSLDLIVGIASILILPNIFTCNYSIGFLIYICFWKYVNKLYHGTMALLVFCWLLGSMAISLRVCSSVGVDFQYLKKIHQCVLEKLSHHLLQLSATNTKDQSAAIVPVAN